MLIYIYTTEHITCISFINDVLLIMLIIVVAIIRTFFMEQSGIFLSLTLQILPFPQFCSLAGTDDGCTAILEKDSNDKNPVVHLC